MTTEDNPGQPEVQQQQATPPTPADESHQQEQTVSVTSKQAAQQLEVDSRTVRRYITDGIRSANGTVVRLKARQVRSGRGPEYLIDQPDLDEFKRLRDHAATEGQDARHLASQQEGQSQALTLSYQIISAELERRNQALVEAQQTIKESQATIERLAREAGRAEALEEQMKMLQQRINELTTERDQWQQKARRQKLYRIQLFPIENED